MKRRSIMQNRQIRFSRNSAFTIFCALLLSALAPALAQQRTFPALDQKLEPLRSQFNQDIGKVRLLVIVDPTCPPCRWGASEIEKQVLETIHDDRLAVYVVWIPVLNFQDEATLQKNGLKESSRVSDPRAIHYIDPSGFSGKQYSPILAIPYHAPAWDVYMTFAPGVRWDERAPTPTDWMDQEGGQSTGPRLLNGRKLAQQVQSLLATTGTKTSAR
jgi:hypothetical protein